MKREILKGEQACMTRVLLGRNYFKFINHLYSIWIEKCMIKLILTFSSFGLVSDIEFPMPLSHLALTMSHYLHLNIGLWIIFWRFGALSLPLWVEKSVLELLVKHIGGDELPFNDLPLSGLLSSIFSKLPSRCLAHGGCSPDTIVWL